MTASQGGATPGRSLYSLPDLDPHHRRVRQLLDAGGPQGPKSPGTRFVVQDIGHFKAIFRLLEIDLVVDARTLTRCCFENLFWQGELADKGASFVEAMVDDEVTSQQSW